MFFNKRKFYTFFDIKYHIRYTPIIFVLVTAVFSIFITFLVLNFEKENAIKLHIKEDNFHSQNILEKYINNIEKKSNASLDEDRIILNKHMNEINGLFKYSKSKISLQELKKILFKIEKKYNTEFILLNANNHILYGQNIINNIRILNNTKAKVVTFKQYISSNIQFSKQNRFIFFLKNNKNKLRLNYFHQINNTSWRLGAFIRVANMKTATKSHILKSIFSQSSKYDKRYLWFYDYENSSVYNYYNNNKNISIYKIFKNDPLNFTNNILREYKNQDKLKTKQGIINFAKYKFLVSIKSNAFSEKINELKFEYNSKLSMFIIFIFLMATFLILASIIFAKFITTIFLQYNKRLKHKTNLYKKLKDRYELAIIASDYGLWDIDLESNKIFFSKKWLEMFAYQGINITTLEDWLCLIHQKDQSDVRKKLTAHLENRTEHFISEFRIKNSFGVYKWVLIRGKVFTNKSNNAKRMIMMSIDIQQNKQLSRDLKNVDLLVEYGKIIIFKWRNDESLTVTYVSKSINTYGYCIKDFESHKIAYFDFIHENDVFKVKKKIKTAISEKLNFFTIRHRIVNSKGKIKWVFNRTILLRDDLDNVTHLYGYISDITRIKIYEQELENKIKNEVEKNIQKDKLLAHQNKLASMGEILGNIAHQWRQPLNNVSLLIYFLRDNYNNFTKDKLNETIQSALLQIEYMSDTIDDFRNYYLPIKEKISFSIKNAIIISSKIVASRFSHTNMQLEILGLDTNIINYKNEFQQVIVNIFNNASDIALVKKKVKDFEAKIIIKLNKKHDFIEINIINNCGEASQEVLNKMFEPYFTTKFENQGTGIGLYMSKTIIEKNMKGHITACNTTDGVKFNILLPL